MGASFNDWMRGLAVIVVGVVGIFALGWLLGALGIAIPVPFRRVVGYLLCLALAWWVLSQIFD